MSFASGSTVAILKRLGVPHPLPYDGLDERFPGVDGGTMNFLMTLSALANRYERVSIFTSIADAEDRTERLGNIEVHRIGLNRRLELEGMERDYAEGLEFAARLAAYAPFHRERFDFIHSHHWSSVLEPLISFLRPHRAHIHTPHLLAAEKMRSLGLHPLPDILKGEKAILSRADQLIALSGAEKESMVSQYNVAPDRVRVIPNGVSSMFVKNRLTSGEVAAALKTRPLRIATVGRIAPQKGLEVLFRALSELRMRNIPVQCSVIGGQYFERRYEEMLRQLLVDLDLNDCVSFAGSLDRMDLVEQLRRSAVYVQSSQYESQGVALLECMAMGLPIVATQSAAVMEMVQHGRTGLLVERGDHIGLSEAICRLALIPQLGVEMSARGQDAGSRYSWETTGSLTVECFEHSSDRGRKQ